MALQKQSSFALLTAANHRSVLSPNVNVGFRDLILRDKAY